MDTYLKRINRKETAMKGIIAYFLGIPVVVIILFYMLDVF